MSATVAEPRPAPTPADVRILDLSRMLPGAGRLSERPRSAWLGAPMVGADAGDVLRGLGEPWVRERAPGPVGRGLTGALAGDRSRGATPVGWTPC